MAHISGISADAAGLRPAGTGHRQAASCREAPHGANGFGKPPPSHTAHTALTSAHRSRANPASATRKLLALATYQTSPLSTAADWLVLDYAVSTSQTSAEVPDALFTQLRARFDDAHLVKLTYIIALANLRGR